MKSPNGRCWTSDTAMSQGHPSIGCSQPNTARASALQRRPGALSNKNKAAVPFASSPPRCLRAQTCDRPRGSAQSESTVYELPPSMRSALDAVSQPLGPVGPDPEGRTHTHMDKVHGGPAFSTPNQHLPLCRQLIRNFYVQRPDSRQETRLHPLPPSFHAGGGTARKGRVGPSPGRHGLCPNALMLTLTRRGTGRLSASSWPGLVQRDSSTKGSSPDAGLRKACKSPSPSHTAKWPIGLWRDERPNSTRSTDA